MLSRMQSTPRGGKAKLDEVTEILCKLKGNLDAGKLPSKQVKQLLEELKVHGRQVENADPIFTEDGIRTLCRYAFESNDIQISQEALRPIANAMLLVPKTRQIVADLGYAPKVADKMKSESIDDEFLTSRILFLMTYDTNLDYEKLVNEHQLAESINNAMARHAKRYSKSARRLSQMHTNAMDLMALSETLKLMFNISHFYPDISEHFSKSIPHIFKILVRRKIPNPPLQAPVNYLINALLNLDLEDKKCQQLTLFGMNAVFPKFDAKCNAEHLINILDNAIIAYPESELDEKVSPVLTLIRRIYEIAPEGVKKYMEWLLLPTDEERTRPLGQSDTLSSRLLRLSTSAMTPSLRGSISAMMFELSGKDATRFVQNVGYGFASGFLLSNNIQIPENALEAHATANQDQAIPVNPITGQRVDMEEEDTREPMTREEKEREAERLFVLFERLKATGVMDVKNPVEEAFQSGRFEELPSDDDDEDSKSDAKVK
ncbi:hypothetical protein BS50DRAFT_597174 [Corynespora cassiicola Philippines]|uniref:Guanine nucleotide exchange factor n=1 Tax=Corynespora cassiicola Philippines TaxID=1448308 RepID=A0A2T2P7S2_CORCC|nr:hypothetical protein BS50DRAFT_597174 [Corynespora cassiicola Philippines]